MHTLYRHHLTHAYISIHRHIYIQGCFRQVTDASVVIGLVLVNWGLTQYQGGEMMMKSVIWWRKPEYPEETTDLRQVTDETFHIRPLPSPGIELGPQRCEAK